MSIKNRRIELGMTQEELARKTGIQVRVLQRIERKNYCNLENAAKIVQALKSTTEKIFPELYENE